MAKGEQDNIVEIVMNQSQILLDELEMLGLQVKHHEDNLRLLNTQMDSIDESIADMQARARENQIPSPVETERQTIESILNLKETPAGLIYGMKIHYEQQASKSPLTSDVLGVVATLGKVNDENLSQLFSEYLGLENMLGIVCKTYEGVTALEKYDKEGMIEEKSGVNGLFKAICKHLDRRYLVFCIEKLRPYTGEFVPDDPQKKLALPKPRLPNGKIPPGFIGFAVNMIDVDHALLSCTSRGHGVRETLFYNLFFHLQVYKTRSDMLHAMPFINEGAISLDGGIMKSNGLFYLGSRQNMDVRFPLSSRISRLLEDETETEKQLRLMNWKKERLIEDMKREDTMLKEVKTMFATKKDEYRRCLTEATANLKSADSINFTPYTEYVADSLYDRFIQF